MYTVVRVTKEPHGSADLRGFAEAIRDGETDWFASERDRGDGYVIELCDDPEWTAHSEAVLRFINECNQILARVRDAGASVVVDVAVEPEDVCGPWLALELPEQLISALASVAAQFTFSVYGSAAND